MSGDNSSNLVEVASSTHFQELLSTDLTRLSLINFWTSWAEPCKQMNEVVQELSKKYPHILALNVEAEAQSEITESFEINSVPTFLILRGHTLLSRIEGADAARLTQDISQHARVVPKAQATTDKVPVPGANDFNEKEETPEELNKRLNDLMNKHKVVLFMKGSPDQPRCGFSRQTVAILRERNVQFDHFDILTDESVRSGLKALNNWPTFPQLIVNGEFVGGLDIIREMIKSGELDEIVA